MPSRLTVTLVGVVLALVLALALCTRWALQEARTATLLQGEVDALTTEVRVLDERLRAVPAELERQRKARRTADAALNEAHDWRATPVPVPVADGLCSRIRCD
jgi:Tfp pilus assembly protein PilN